MLKKPWKFPARAHKLPPRVSCNHIEPSKEYASKFLSLSALSKYKMNGNIENHYDQTFNGNHLKEECNKKSFSQKTGMILLQDVSEKDRASTTRIET